MPPSTLPHKLPVGPAPDPAPPGTTTDDTRTPAPVPHGPAPVVGSPHRARWLGAAGALALAAGIAGWLAWRPLPVQVAPALAGPLVQTLVFTGRVAAQSRVEVGATVTGRVAEVRVREGASVRAGEVLARLDDDEAAAALRQWEAAERTAQARVVAQRELSAPLAVAGLAAADAGLRAAQAELDRTARLVDRGFVSQARLDDARRNVDVAQAQVAQARAQARANAARGSETEQARLRLEEARAASGTARARLAQARILAPADALVLTRSVEPGQVVQPGRVLFTLAIEAPTQLVALVDETSLGRLAPGQRATVIADAYPDTAFEARVRSVSPAIDPQRGAVEVKFSVPLPPPFLRNDMTLSLEVETARREQTLSVPVQAVQQAPRAAAAAPVATPSPAAPPATPTTPGAAVKVVREGRVAELPVSLGVRTLDRVEVIAGLVEGDAVLLDPTVPVGRRVRATSEPLGRPAAGGVSVRDAELPGPGSGR